jgi:hypothetical protein
MSAIKVTGEYSDLNSFHRAGHRTTADRIVQAIELEGEKQRRSEERAAELEHERKLAEIRNGTVKPSRRLKPLNLLFPRSEFRLAIANLRFENPKASDHELIVKIDEGDAGDVPMLNSWKKKPTDRLFEEAYKDRHGGRRRKIQIEINKVNGIMRAAGYF